MSDILNFMLLGGYFSSVPLKTFGFFFVTC